MDFNKEQFQQAVNDIIGNSTKAAFAEELGISRVYLQNLLSEKAKKPSKELVLNIAQYATDSAQKMQLLMSCNLESELSEAEKRLLMTDEEWCDANAEDVKAFLRDCVVGHLFPKESGKEQFKEMFEMLYGATSSVIVWTDVEEYQGEKFGAETVAQVRFVFYSRKRKLKQIMTVVLYGFESKKGNHYVLGCGLSPRDLVEVFPSKWSAFYEKVAESQPHIYDAEYAFVCQIYDPVQQMLDDMKGRKPMTPQERLVNALFGDSEEDAIVSIIGMGFYLDDEPEKLVEFVRNHRESFEETEEQKAFCKGVLDEGEEPAVFYQKYDPYLQGPASVVATIMAKETGVPFEGWDHENEDERNRNCVLLDEKESAKHQSDCVRAMLKKYATELHLPRIEACIYYMPINLATYGGKSEELVYEA